MTILAIDTSTIRASVAVLANDALVFQRAFTADRTHSASLFGILEEICTGQGLKPEKIVLGLGPGSYAGVRISISAAMGLELALDAPLFGIPSVAALDCGESHYVAIGDARRDSYYWTLVHDGVCDQGPELVSREELIARAAAIALPLVTVEELPAFPEARLAYPDAVRLARLAATGRGITATGLLEPIYLRDPHITLPKRTPGLGRAG